MPTNILTTTEDIQMKSSNSHILCVCNLMAMVCKLSCRYKYENRTLQLISFKNTLDVSVFHSLVFCTLSIYVFAGNEQRIDRNQKCYESRNTVWNHNLRWLFVKHFSERLWYFFIMLPQTVNQKTFVLDNTKVRMSFVLPVSHWQFAFYRIICLIRHFFSNVTF